MEKEIHEQPDSVQHTLSHYLDFVNGKAKTNAVDFAAIDRIQIVACGTAFYAGQIGRYAFEKLADLPCDVEIASEFRYRKPALTPGTLAVAVSQSGETADTLAACRWCKAQGAEDRRPRQRPFVVHGARGRRLWPTHAGPEIGVASTKAFTAQVAALLALAVAAGVAARPDRRRRGGRTGQGPVRGAAPDRRGHGHGGRPQGRRPRHRQGRRTSCSSAAAPMFPLAMEGALKLKEISYIHAEGYAAGELKHGPIALVDE